MQCLGGRIGRRGRRGKQSKTLNSGSGRTRWGTERRGQIRLCKQAASWGNQGDKVTEHPAAESGFHLGSHRLGPPPFLLPPKVRFFSPLALSQKGRCEAVLTPSPLVIPHFSTLFSLPSLLLTEIGMKFLRPQSVRFEKAA